jgi:nucleoside-diphosphate-sugar epimerase
MKRVVVTGATSMLGVALINELLKTDIEVYAVVRCQSNKIDRLPVSRFLEIVYCDIDNYKELPDLIHLSCDTFYNMAWQATGSPEMRNRQIEVQSRNIIYSLDAVTAAKELGCRKYIGAGSQAEYGLLDLDRISPDSPCNPIQPYGIAKYAAGKLVRAKAEQLGIDCCWVRIFSVYGEHDRPGSLVSSTIHKLMNSEMTSFTPAEQRWDFLNEQDAGAALYAIGEHSNGNKIYCLGSGKARLLKEYIEEIKDCIGIDIELGFGKEQYRPNCVMNLCADISALTSDTGWTPKISFHEGIMRIIENMKENEDVAER